MHEIFEEICAAAAIGQADPQELATLHDHLRGCTRCRQAYSEFTNIASHAYVESPRTQLVSPEHEAVLANADALRDGFLRRAVEVLSGKLIPPKAPQSHSSVVSLWRRAPINATTLGRAAAVLALVLLPSAYEVGRWAASGAAQAIGGYSAYVSKAPPSGAHYPDQEGQYEGSAAQIQIASLKDEVKTKDRELKSLKRRLKVSSENAVKLLSAQARLEAAQNELKRQLQESGRLSQQRSREQDLLLQKIGELQTALNTAQASYVADEITIHDLTEKVASKRAAAERNAELLERDRDIRDLMTARNLHIFDVFDTDAKGKTKPAFGRIFYTEGKSLIFYAYDLNEAKPASAGYHYRVWGGREGEKNKATSLGLFYSDDKEQRRWVFKCNDAKILAQIDSVFVTLERNRSDSPYPRGQKLLDAYLGGAANHP